MEAVTRREAILAGFGASLPDDSTARLIDRESTQPDLSYVLLDVRSRQVIASRWPSRDYPLPVGSLVKPFVAFAHAGDFPEITCRGEADRCWKRGGHGRLQLPLAIAHSCNAYFLDLARNVDLRALAQIGLPVPATPTPESLIGLGEGWRIPPVILANAYCELLTRANRDILRGLRLSAKSGTSREIHCDAYAKTGSAPCHHQKRTLGDGYAIALYAMMAPRFVLLASLDGAPGSHAAGVCGAILRRVG